MPTRSGSQTRVDRPVPTFDHLKAKPPLRVTDYIPLDQEVADAAKVAEEALNRALMTAKQEFIGPAQRARDAAQAKLQLPEHSVEVIFEAPGSAAWAALKAKHPPTEEQSKLAREQKTGVDYNAETLAPHLVALTCVQPAMTEKQALELWADPNWGDAELVRLFSAAIAVTLGRRQAGDYRFS